MYKNQLQELAQRSCFNLPSYTCIREGPDHAPRFKATVNFNGEIFESPHYCSTLRQAEHSAAEVALNSLSHRGPSPSLAARILDETGVYKNLLQEIAQRVGAPLPQYTTIRSGLGHLPVFKGMVELAGITFTGEPAKNKKQAEKNAAMAAWTSLKQLAKETASSSTEPENNDELEQITIARALLNYRLKEKMAMANSRDAPIPFTKKFPVQSPRPTSPQPPATASKILPLICPKAASRHRPASTAMNDKQVLPVHPSAADGRGTRPQRFPAAGAAPYVPIRQFRTCHGIAPPVTVRTAVPCFSAPPLPPPSVLPHQVMRAPPVRIAPPVTIRQAVPAYTAPQVRKDDSNTPRKDHPATIVSAIRKDPQKVIESAIQKEVFPAVVDPPILKKDPPTINAPATPDRTPCQVEKNEIITLTSLEETEAVQSLGELKI
ncbi:double-stranded RNA-binding protein 2-like [Mangifera indica]|uniref:double-stranded RNA-binding protein 2-like n=1 Tax=Mangifera indica TaxID=29780 RepID=UPI001CFB28D7|nr:double-stranded RNA-binding protein 2-like [Mangifera indica]